MKIAVPQAAKCIKRMGCKINNVIKDRYNWNNR